MYKQPIHVMFQKEKFYVIFYFYAKVTLIYIQAITPVIKLESLELVIACKLYTNLTVEFKIRKLGPWITELQAY